jgi:hypothetical protein
MQGPHFAAVEMLTRPGAERFLRHAKIFIAEPREKAYYRFCGYGNYENIRLSLYPVVGLPRSLGLIGFRLGNRPAKGPRRHDGNLFGIES